MGGMWERRFANAPVCGVKSRGSCWKRRLSGLWPKLSGVERSSNLLLLWNKAFTSNQLIVVHDA